MNEQKIYTNDKVYLSQDTNGYREGTQAKVTEVFFTIEGEVSHYEIMIDHKYFHVVPEEINSMESLHN